MNVTILLESLHMIALRGFQVWENSLRKAVLTIVSSPDARKNIESLYFNPSKKRYIPKMSMDLLNVEAGLSNFPDDRRN